MTSKSDDIAQTADRIRWIGDPSQLANAGPQNARFQYDRVRRARRLIREDGLRNQVTDASRRFARAPRREPEAAGNLDSHAG